MIHKPLSLQGQEMNTTIIHGSGNTAIFSIGSDDVTIEQMTIKEGFMGIHIENSNSIQIQQTTIIDQYIGIEIQGSSNIQIHENEITGIDVYGIHIIMSSEHDSNSLIISNNLIQNNEQGIFLADGQDHNIYENIITENQVGLSLFMTNGEPSIIENNQIKENNDGIILYSEALKSPIIIQHNTIIQNYNAGISCFVDPSTFLSEEHTALIQYNNIYQNQQQAYMYLTVNGLSDIWNIFNGRRSLFHSNYWATTSTSPYPIPADMSVFIGIIPQLIYQGTLIWGYDTDPAIEPYQ